jgi:hypothetical protein
MWTEGPGYRVSPSYTIGSGCRDILVICRTCDAVYGWDGECLNVYISWLIGRVDQRVKGSRIRPVDDVSQDEMYERCSQDARYNFSPSKIGCVMA